VSIIFSAGVAFCLGLYLKLWICCAW